MKSKIIKLLIIIIIFVSFILFVFSRLRFFDDELYVKLFSEDICFNFQKHLSQKDILDEFKRLKKESYVKIKYIDESYSSLLYSNESDVFRIIEIKNGKIENSLYMPHFDFEIDGRYVSFTFEDKFLKHIDGIMMSLDTNANETQSFYIPINTRTDKYNFIIKLNDENILDYNFSIDYAHWSGSNWKLKL